MQSFIFLILSALLFKAIPYKTRNYALNLFDQNFVIFFIIIAYTADLVNEII